MLIGSRKIRHLRELRSTKLLVDAERLNPCCHNEACGYTFFCLKITSLAPALTNDCFRMDV